MSELVTLTEDGPFGPAGTQVWVNDPSDVTQPAKKTAQPKKHGLKATAEPVDKI